MNARPSRGNRPPPGPDSPASWLTLQPSSASRRDILTRYTPYSLSRDLKSGAIVRLLPGVYIGATQADNPLTRADAALRWAGPGVSLGGTTAAYLHGILAKPPPTVTLSAPVSARLRPPDWIQVIQPKVVGQPAKTRGLRAVPLEDALLQAWSQLGAENGTGLILDAVRMDLVTAGVLALRMREYPRIRDRRHLARLLDPLHSGVQSYLEHLAATRVFNTVDFAEFTRQHRIRAAGRSYILDLFDERARLAVELDGRRFHGDDEARRRDLARDAELAAIGILTIRLTFDDIRLRPAWCRTRVRKALASRRPRSKAA